MRPDKHILIEHLLNDPGSDARREIALLAGNRILRRRRWLRRGRHASLLLALAFAAFLSIPKPERPKLESHSVTPATPAPEVPYLTDDQLLALFPDTPVGLATLGNKKILVFPRPDDRERYVGAF